MKALAIVLIGVLLGFAGCSQPEQAPIEKATPTPESTPPEVRSNVPKLPNLQAELLDERYQSTASPIGRFDFRNFTYELPRGWQNPDGSNEFTLTNGRVAPVGGATNDEMSDEEKAEVRAHRRIGMSFVTAKYFDVTGDGEDEAAVILKVETGGAAIPQIAYIFTWKDGAPELLWPFRTGDRADGGLKNIYPSHGEIVVELFGQDRFVLGQTETLKITGDEEQLCCPTYFTRSVYKWNGKSFLMQGKRLTFSLTDPSASPLVNYGDIVNDPKKKG